MAGYDINGDGLGDDCPRIADLSVLGRSVSGGRQLPGGGPLDTISQQQLPGTAFIPAQAGTIGANERVYLPGSVNEGTIGRNTFFGRGGLIPFFWIGRLDFRISHLR
jgi:hypothetical protein